MDYESDRVRRRRSFGACDDLLWELDEVRDAEEEEDECTEATAGERLRPWSFAAHNARKILATAPASSRYAPVTLRVDGVDGVDAGVGELIQLADAVLWSKSSGDQPCYCFRKSCLAGAHLAGNILTLEATAPSFSGSLRLDFRLPGSRGASDAERARHFAPLLTLSRSVTAHRRKESAAALAATQPSPGTRVKQRAARFLGGSSSSCNSSENERAGENAPRATMQSTASKAAATNSPAVFKAVDAIDAAWKADVRRYARLSLLLGEEETSDLSAAQEACTIAESLVLSIGYTIGKTEVGPVKRRSRRRMLKALLPLAEEMEAARKADCAEWESSTRVRCEEVGGANAFFDTETGEPIAVEEYEARCNAYLVASSPEGVAAAAAAAAAALSPALRQRQIDTSALPPLPSPVPRSRTRAPVADAEGKPSAQRRERAFGPGFPHRSLPHSLPTADLTPEARAALDAAIAAAEQRLWSGFDTMLSAFAAEKLQLQQQYGLHA